MKDIRERCPGVQIICCDEGYDPDGNVISAESCENTHPQIPTNDWLNAIQAVNIYHRLASQASTPVIVAHRETIRNLVLRDGGSRISKLAYCCVAEFQVEIEAGRNPLASSDELTPQTNAIAVNKISLGKIY